MNVQKMVNINSTAKKNSYFSYLPELGQRKSPVQLLVPLDIQNKHTINVAHISQTQILYFWVNIKFNIIPV